MLTPGCLPTKFREKVLDEAQPVSASTQNAPGITANTASPLGTTRVIPPANPQRISWRTRPAGRRAAQPGTMGKLRTALADAPDYAALHPEIPLAKIYATRNRVTHAYEEVDTEIIWNLVLLDVPDLKPKIVAALNDFKETGLS